LALTEVAPMNVVKLKIKTIRLILNIIAITRIQYSARSFSLCYSHVRKVTTPPNPLAKARQKMVWNANLTGVALGFQLVLRLPPVLQISL
jgi:hypothetical protein